MSNQQKSIFRLFVMLFTLSCIFSSCASKRTGILKREGTVISNMRTLATCEALYNNTFGIYTDLQGLYKEDLIDSELASGHKQGYKYATFGTIDEYSFAFIAVPISPELGKRHFYIDETGVIRASDGKTASVKEPSSWEPL